MDVESIRDAKKKGVVAFAKFCQDKKGHEDYLFCIRQYNQNRYLPTVILKLIMPQVVHILTTTSYI